MFKSKPRRSRQERSRSSQSENIVTVSTNKSSSLTIPLNAGYITGIGVTAPAAIALTTTVGNGVYFNLSYTPSANQIANYDTWRVKKVSAIITSYGGLSATNFIVAYDPTRYATGTAAPAELLRIQNSALYCPYFEKRTEYTIERPTHNVILSNDVGINRDWIRTDTAGSFGSIMFNALAPFGSTLPVAPTQCVTFMWELEFNGRRGEN